MILVSKAITYRIALFVTTFYLSTQLWVGISLLAQPTTEVHILSSREALPLIALVVVDA